MQIHAHNSYQPHGTSLHPVANHWLRWLETILGLLGLGLAVTRHGREVSAALPSLVSWLVVLAVAIPATATLWRYSWSLARKSFLQQNLPPMLLSAIWLAGLVTAVGLSDGVPELLGPRLLAWTELIAMSRGVYEIYAVVRGAADAGLNPALVLVLSFVGLIGIGTLLLMLPRCRPDGELPADWLTALFTATSACCVTGLVVNDTSVYWSRTGHVVIMALIQVGGLGIMTFGAFFAVVMGSKLLAREHATMRDLLESEQLGDVAGLIRSILGFTIIIELVGACLLTTLWPELPLLDRLFYGLFHSVSAFCNAGFALRSNSLMGWELSWQVWGVFPLLIILGGFGFTPLRNIWHVIRWRLGLLTLEPGSLRPRLTLTTRLVAVTTLGLLVVGTVVLFLLEWNNSRHPLPVANQFANAWFHSVTLRTAGFNTIDHEQLAPGSKLFGISMMFIGASPGSTGGGMKTISLALIILTLRSILRGRSNVEVYGRTIPETQVFRGLAVIGMGLATLMAATIVVVMIEDRADRFLDQAYEAASALGTVGVSANLTPTLKPASQLVLILTMLLGRVGPLTLIVALAGRGNAARYRYPEERIALG